MPNKNQTYICRPITLLPASTNHREALSYLLYSDWSNFLDRITARHTKSPKTFEKVSIIFLGSSSDDVKDANNGTYASVRNQDIEIIKKHRNYCSMNLWRHIIEVHCETKYNTDQIEVSAFHHVC